MHRRQFLQALAASVVAVGAPLPVGFPTEQKLLGPVELWAQKFYNEYRSQQLWILNQSSHEVTWSEIQDPNSWD